MQECRLIHAPLANNVPTSPSDESSQKNCYKTAVSSNVIIFAKSYKKQVHSLKANHFLKSKAMLSLVFVEINGPKRSFMNTALLVINYIAVTICRLLGTSFARGA